jgi:hypothetical protein
MMNGPEVLGINEKGAVPVKLQSGVSSYRGRRAVRLVNDDGPVGTVSAGQVLAIVNASDFEDGTIEAEIVGCPRQGAQPSTRGLSALRSACKIMDRRLPAKMVASDHTFMRERD